MKIDYLSEIRKYLSISNKRILTYKESGKLLSLILKHTNETVNKALEADKEYRKEVDYGEDW